MTAPPTEQQVQDLRADIGDYKAPLILPIGRINRAWERAGGDENKSRVYALMAIVAKFTTDRDPRLPQYKELLEMWQDQAGMKRGKLESGVIDLGLTIDCEDIDYEET